MMFLWWYMLIEIRYKKYKENNFVYGNVFNIGVYYKIVED